MLFFKAEMDKIHFGFGRLTHVGEQTGDGLNVSSRVHVAQLVNHGQTHRMDPDPPFSFRDRRIDQWILRCCSAQTQLPFAQHLSGDHVPLLEV